MRLGCTLYKGHHHFALLALVSERLAIRKRVFLGTPLVRKSKSRVFSLLKGKRGDSSEGLVEGLEFSPEGKRGLRRPGSRGELNLGLHNMRILPEHPWSSGMILLSTWG